MIGRFFCDTKENDDTSDTIDHVSDIVTMALSPVTRAGWVAALDIVIHKPHSVDKRLAGQVELEVWEGEWGMMECEIGRVLERILSVIQFSF